MSIKSSLIFILCSVWKFDTIKLSPYIMKCIHFWDLNIFSAIMAIKVDYLDIGRISIIHLPDSWCNYLAGYLKLKQVGYVIWRKKYRHTIDFKYFLFYFILKKDRVDFRSNIRKDYHAILINIILFFQDLSNMDFLIQFTSPWKSEVIMHLKTHHQRLVLKIRIKLLRKMRIRILSLKKRERDRER